MLVPLAEPDAIVTVVGEQEPTCRSHRAQNFWRRRVVCEGSWTEQASTNMVTQRTRRWAEGGGGGHGNGTTFPSTIQ